MRYFLRGSIYTEHVHHRSKVGYMFVPAKIPPIFNNILMLKFLNIRTKGEFQNESLSSL